MSALIQMDPLSVEAQLAIIMSEDSNAAARSAAMFVIGGAIGRALDDSAQTSIYSARGVQHSKASPPLADLSIVVTTRSDAASLGSALQKTLTPALQGYIDMEGHRGLAALNAPIRDMRLPYARIGQIKRVVVAKAIMATGCTAVSLARAAIARYPGAGLVVTSAFYSLEGLLEVRSELPEATIVVIGEAVPLRADGTLGIGAIADAL